MPTPHTDPVPSAHSRLGTVCIAGQGYHYDWNQDTLKKVKGSLAVTVVATIDNGGSILFAAPSNAGTKESGEQLFKNLKAATERRVRIPEMGACVFRGNMWHAGDMYEGEHWRMHFYLLRAKGEPVASFRNTPGGKVVGLHAVECIDAYDKSKSVVDAAAVPDFDAVGVSAFELGRELEKRGW